MSLKREAFPLSTVTMVEPPMPSQIFAPAKGLIRGTTDEEPFGLGGTSVVLSILQETTHSSVAIFDLV
jgi:hypothetical protein